MNDLERDLRTLFDAKSGDAPTAPKPPTNLLRRARARQLRTAFVAGLGAVAIMVGSVAGIRALVTTDGTTTADQPTETTTMNGVSITHPEGWQPIDPDAAGLNGSGPEAGAPRLILALAPFDTGELFGCPGMVEGTMPTFLLTIQEQPLALAGGSASPWPAELQPLFVESAGATGVVEATGGCYPGWEFLRAGWTESGRTFEARMGIAPDISDDDRRALLDAYASMTFERSADPASSVVIATGTAGGEAWELTATRQSDGLSLSLQAETFGTGGGFTHDTDQLQLTSHVFGDGEGAEVVVLGAVPLEVATVEAFPAMGSPAVSVDVLDVPDEIDQRLNAFVVVADADLPVDINAYDAAGNVVLRGTTGADRGPVETPLPGEQLFRGRTNDCRWRINAGPQAPNPQALQLVPDDGTGSVTVPLDLGENAPALQLGLFRCETGGTLALGLLTSEVQQIRWLPTLGDELLEGVGCIPADLPDGFCFFLSDHVDLSAGGEAIALDTAGTEIGRTTFRGGAPQEVLPLHGGTYWGLYVAVNRSLDDPEMDAAFRGLGDMGYSPTTEDIACDDGAAAELNVPEHWSRVAIYFASREDAETAWEGVYNWLRFESAGIAEVTTYCLD